MYLRVILYYFTTATITTHMWSDDTLAIFDKVRVEDKYSLYTSVHASTVYAGYVCVCGVKGCLLQT